MAHENIHYGIIFANDHFKYNVPGIPKLYKTTLIVLHVYTVHTYTNNNSVAIL